MRLIKEAEVKDVVDKKLKMRSEFDPVAMQTTLQNNPNDETKFVRYKVDVDSDDSSDDNDDDKDGDDCNGEFDRESYSSDEESNCSADESDATGDLTDKMCNLSVADKNKLEDEGFIPRSPVHPSVCISNKSHPYQLDPRRKNNFPIDKGEFMGQNTTFVHKSLQAGSIVQQPINNFSNTKDLVMLSSEIMNNWNDIKLDLLTFAEEQLNNEEIVSLSNFDPEDLNIYLNDDSTIEKSFTPSEDSFCSSPSGCSFYSSEGSPAEDSGYQHSPASELSTLNEFPIIDFEDEVFVSQNMAKNDKKTLNVFKPLESDIVQTNEICTPNFVLNFNTEPVMLQTNKSRDVPDSYKKIVQKPMEKQSNYVFSSQKTNKKLIQPIGVVVYDNHEPASKRLYNLCSHQSRLYNVRYICAITKLKTADKLNTDLFQFLKEERKLPADVWLISLYAYIEYLFGVVTGVKTGEEKQNFIEILTNKEAGESLLYLACKNHTDLPIAARYIAETMVKLNININEVYGPDSNTLIHVLVEKAVSSLNYVKLIAELMHVKKDNIPVFNINCTNGKFQTPLHIAAIYHSANEASFTTVKYLVDHHAAVEKDIYGRTPLHYAVSGACEPTFVQKILPLISSEVVDVQDCMGDTALNLASKNYTTDPEKLEKVILLLKEGSKNQTKKKSKPLCPVMVSV